MFLDSIWRDIAGFRHNKSEIKMVFRRIGKRCGMPCMSVMRVENSVKLPCSLIFRGLISYRRDTISEYSRTRKSAGHAKDTAFAPSGGLCGDRRIRSTLIIIRVYLLMFLSKHDNRVLGSAAKILWTRTGLSC